jgi:hypothetical protein
MSRTPAAHLALLKMTYRSWDIRHADGGGAGFTALRRDERGGLRSMYAPTVPELEAALAAAEAEASR